MEAKRPFLYRILTLTLAMSLGLGWTPGLMAQQNPRPQQEITRMKQKYPLQKKEQQQQQKPRQAQKQSRPQSNQKGTTGLTGQCQAY